MFLPIYAYGQPVLRKKATPIEKDYPNLEELIKNMWETMYKASGVGLAAPQVGLSIRLFTIDTLQLKEERRKNEPGMVRVFINAEKVQEDGALGSFEEGCLSIPDVRGDVERPERLTLKFMDENFVEKTEVFTGINARVIQHEYDHIDGVLFVDHLKPLKKRMVQKRLDKIKIGMVDTDYKMKFAKI